MTLFSGLVRRAAAEVEHRLRAGAGLLAAIAGDPEGTAARERLLECEERLRRMERVIEGQDRDLRALRTDLDSLIVQLNDRLLPRIDERMDDTERDLTTLATGLIRADRESVSSRSRLETLENRLADLRGKLVRMEQRAGLWRDLQATMARLGDDIDTLRSRLPARPAAPSATAASATSAVSTPSVQATAAAQPAQAAQAAAASADHVSENGSLRLGGPDPRGH
ncbi:hypothetical protein GCM10023085_47860 [Actinomadura viridis]|uniref:TolA-binding protein n=1 Tax=Actinomadura viridis TaxID=58110 RepID=A0A931DJS0_9ACTN|nr:hypothetical protein [Actinomadura viridis]MBG6090712.1 TolA-binding protein [Actinomadura viridis]